MEVLCSEGPTDILTMYQGFALKSVNIRDLTRMRFHISACPKCGFLFHFYFNGVLFYCVLSLIVSLHLNSKHLVLILCV